MDGLRWQELFSGADSLLVANKAYVNDTTGLKEHFWRDSPIERREALFPFLRNEVSKMGQIHGNRNLGSKVDLTNKMWFSYPGYSFGSYRLFELFDLRFEQTFIKSKRFIGEYLY